MSIERLVQLDRVRHNQFDAEKAQLAKLKQDAETLLTHVDARVQQGRNLHTLRDRIRTARTTLLPLTRKRKQRAGAVAGATPATPATTPAVPKRTRRKPKVYTYDELVLEVEDSIKQVTGCGPGEPAKSLYAKLESLNQIITSCTAFMDTEVAALRDTVAFMQDHIDDIATNRSQNEYFTTSTAHVAAAGELQRKFQKEVDRIQAALRFGTMANEQRKAMMTEYDALYAAFNLESDQLLQTYAKDTGTDLANPGAALRHRVVRIFRDKAGHEYVRCVKDGLCVRLSTQVVSTTPESQKAAAQALETYEEMIGTDPFIALTGPVGSGGLLRGSVKRKKQYRKSLEASVDKKLRRLQGNLGNASAMDEMMGDIESFLAGGPAADSASSTAARTTVAQQETTKAAREELHRELTAIYTVEQRGNKNPYIYKKENHMRDLMNAVQGKCQSILPSAVMDQVRAELAKYANFDYDTLVPTRVRRILGDHGLVTYYDHAWYITHVLNPKYQLCCFVKQHEERVLQRFCALERPFEELKAVVVHARRNMMSYPFTAFKICELEEFLAEHALEQRQRDLEALRAQPQDREFTVENVYAHCQDGYEILTRGVGAAHIRFRERFDPQRHAMVHVLRVEDCCEWLETRVAFLRQEMEAWRGYRPYFKFLKDGRLMKKQDRWWRLCCEKLHWPQIKTVGNESFSFVSTDTPWKYETRPISPRRVAAYNAKFSFGKALYRPPITADTTASSTASSSTPAATTVTLVPETEPGELDAGDVSDMDLCDVEDDAMDEA